MTSASLVASGSSKETTTQPVSMSSSSSSKGDPRPKGRDSAYHGPPPSPPLALVASPSDRGSPPTRPPATSSAKAIHACLPSVVRRPSFTITARSSAKAATLAQASPEEDLGEDRPIDVINEERTAKDVEHPLINEDQPQDLSVRKRDQECQTEIPFDLKREILANLMEQSLGQAHHVRRSSKIKTQESSPTREVSSTAGHNSSVGLASSDRLKELYLRTLYVLLLRTRDLLQPSPPEGRRGAKSPKSPGPGSLVASSSPKKTTNGQVASSSSTPPEVSPRAKLPLSLEDLLRSTHPEGLLRNVSLNPGPGAAGHTLNDSFPTPSAHSTPIADLGGFGASGLANLTNSANTQTQESQSGSEAAPFGITDTEIIKEIFNVFGGRDLHEVETEFDSLLRQQGDLSSSGAIFGRSTSHNIHELVVSGSIPTTNGHHHPQPSSHPGKASPISGVFPHDWAPLDPTSNNATSSGLGGRHGLRSEGASTLSHPTSTTTSRQDSGCADDPYHSGSSVFGNGDSNNSSAMAAAASSPYAAAMLSAIPGYSGYNPYLAAAAGRYPPAGSPYTPLMNHSYAAVAAAATMSSSQAATSLDDLETASHTSGKSNRSKDFTFDPSSIKREPDDYLSVSGRARHCRDEKKSRELGITFTMDDIINLPMDEFNDMLSRQELTEEQLNLCRDIRRRGKNKVAAQNCRKRKIDQIAQLEEEVHRARTRKQNLLMERENLFRQRDEWRSKLMITEEDILANMGRAGKDYRLDFSAPEVRIIRREEMVLGGHSSVDQMDSSRFVPAGSSSSSSSQHPNFNWKSDSNQHS